MPWQSVPPSTELEEGDRVRHFYEFTLPDFFGIDDIVAQWVDDVFRLQQEINERLGLDEEIRILNTNVRNISGGTYQLTVEYVVEHASPLAISLTSTAIIAAATFLIGFGVGLTLTGAEKFKTGLGLGAAAAAGIILLSGGDDG